MRTNEAQLILFDKVKVQHRLNRSQTKSHIGIAFRNPLKAAWVALRGVRTAGPLAPEINLSNQRPAQYVFSEQVQKKLSEMRSDEAAEAAAKQKTPTAA